MDGFLRTNEWWQSSHYLLIIIVDGEYEVTADMLIHEDIDDERTLEEEEDDILKEDQDKELSDLQKVCKDEIIIFNKGVK